MIKPDEASRHSQRVAIDGDGNVVGDGNTVQVTKVTLQTAPPANPRARRNRQAMLQLVRNTWIAGVLERLQHFVYR